MLTTIDRWAVVAQLIKNMRGNGGWAGETHIQKTLYFLQELLDVPGSYTFVLYKHGPYSFDLHDDLGKMRANLALDIEPQPPYGSSFKLGPLGEKSIQRGQKAVDQYNGHLQFVVDSLGTKNVRELEQYGTALLVRSRYPNSEDGVMASKIIELKPHIDEDAALEAVRSVAKIENEAKAKGLIR